MDHFSADFHRMLSPNQFRDLVSGRRRGAIATILRGLLRAAEVPYTLAVRWRNGRYDRGRRASLRAAVPVVSIGNLTLGGTGKTPMVKWIVHWLGDRGVRVAIVSRGYRAAAGQPNDEARELECALPGVAHLQNPDRVAAARRAVHDFGCQIVVLDDGFQHRRLRRDLDIVLIDALEPFGFDHVFPRGTLREPLAALGRANVICLSRADAVSADECARIRARVRALAPHAAWCEVVHAPSGLVNASGVAGPIGMLTGRRVAAFCGIGNPAGFRHTLAQSGCQIAAWREFPDHRAFNQMDLNRVREMATDADADLVVCTHKDLVKVPHDELAGRPLWAVTIDLHFLAGQEALEQALMRVVATVDAARSGNLAAAATPLRFHTAPRQKQT